MVRSVQAAFVCKRRMPLNESIDLSIDDRILAGDLEAIHDFAREAIADLERIADEAAALLCDEPDVVRRLAAVRLRQSATGRQWHGASISGAFDQETGTTDRAGKEPRGPRRAEGKPRQAKVGKPANKRGKRASS